MCFYQNCKLDSTLGLEFCVPAMCLIGKVHAARANIAFVASPISSKAGIAQSDEIKSGSGCKSFVDEHLALTLLRELDPGRSVCGVITFGRSVLL